MKKIIILLFFISIITMIFKQDKQVVIPKESIRFRIIANSNKEEDQNLKMTIRNDLEPKIISYLNDTKNVEEAKEKLCNYLPNIDQDLKKYNTTYSINLGNNYFPEKEYKGVIYPEGKYESLVITLGEGLGDNWWCVLFPPLCLLEADENNLDDIQYQFFIKKIIDKL